MRLHVQCICMGRIHSKITISHLHSPTVWNKHTYTHARTQMLPGALSNALARFPLGSGELEEEPLYVNAKQYHRILKRRQARARLEQEGKIPKQRQVCVCALCT